jgi:hypothetical protein
MQQYAKQGHDVAIVMFILMTVYDGNAVTVDK